MKKLLLSFITVLLLISCSNPNGKSWDEYGLKGRVKTCIHTGSTINYVNGEYVRTGNINDNIYEFNSDGLIVKLRSENTDELLRKLSFSVLYKYDEDGILQETENFGYDGTFSSKTLYNYDGEMLVEKNTYDEFNRKINQEKFQYNNDGLLLSQYVSRYMSDVRLSSKIFYKYNYIDGILLWKKKYNAENNTLLYISRFENDKEISRESSKGETMYISYNDNALPSHITNGKFYMDLFMMSSEDIVEFVGLSDSSYEYKYDSYGNWVEKVELLGEGKIPTRLERRTITYY